MRWVLRVSLAMAVLPWAAEPCPGGWPSPRAGGQSAPAWSVQPLVASSSCATCEIPHPAVCIIRVRDRDGNWSRGSGTLIATDGSRSVVMTCWHLFRDWRAPLEIKITWPDGQESVSQQVTMDVGQDLAAIVVTPPVGITPVAIADDPKIGETSTASGWGPGNSPCYQTATGRLTGYVSSRDGVNRWMEFTGKGTRSGDSGGPMLSGGKLSGVLWGSSGNKVRASGPKRIFAFLRQRERKVLPWNSQGKPCPWHSAGRQCPCKAPVKAMPEPPASVVSPEQPQPEQIDQIAAILAELAELRILIAAIDHGPPGESGPAGIQGLPGPAAPPGVDGKDGAVGESGQNGKDGKDGRDGVSPVIDYDILAAKLVPLLPVLTFQVQDAEGNVMRNADGKLLEFSAGPDGVVSLNELARILPPIILRTLDDEGNQVDRVEVRLGEVVNLHHQIALPSHGSK